MGKIYLGAQEIMPFVVNKEVASLQEGVVANAMESQSAPIGRTSYFKGKIILTKAQYEAIEGKDPDAEYLVVDDDTYVQDAIQNGKTYARKDKEWIEITQGNAGVAVSDEAPTDPDVKVWLKPDGEAPEFATKEDLKGKADLEPTTKTVLPAQISPLLGRQTGANCTNGIYQNRDTSWLQTGSIAVEWLFKVGDIPVAQIEVIGYMSGSEKSPRIDIRQNNMVNCFCGGNFSQFKAINGSWYHVVVAYDALTSQARMFVNGVLVHTINAAPFPSGYFNLGGHGLAGDWRFSGILAKCRVFNYSLSDAECLSLWNNGDPANLMLSDGLRAKCVAEYLPCGLLTDKWRDTSGNGNDIAAVGTPKLSYEAVPDMNEITVDTGVFYTNIEEGVSSKTMIIPRGYCISHILLKNNNPNELKAFKGSLDFGGGLLWGGVNITYYGHTRGNWYAITPAKCWYPRLGQACSISITAQGNTTDGGMQVKLICKYIG